MSDLNDEIRKDGALLEEVMRLLESQTPLGAWPWKALDALAGAIGGHSDNRYERAKVQRLEQHLFRGPMPAKLAAVPAAPSRRADRLRADLADLMPCGCALYLVSDEPCGRAG